jgi:hypothetical protein
VKDIVVRDIDFKKLNSIMKLLEKMFFGALNILFI